MANVAIAGGTQNQKPPSDGEAGEGQRFTHASDRYPKEMTKNKNALHRFYSGARRIFMLFKMDSDLTLPAACGSIPGGIPRPASTSF